jgi:hypothetical protein
MVWSLYLAKLEPTALNCSLAVNLVLPVHTVMMELAAAYPAPQVTTATIQLWGHCGVSLDTCHLVGKLPVLFVQVVRDVEIHV